MAKFPTGLRSLRKQYGFTTTNVFTTTNPKTEKNGRVSESPTLVLHLEPVTGGVCPAAGSCAALCLNKAGNPLYMEAKLSRRQKRTHAFMNNRNAFLELIILEAARYYAKGYVAIRLNGTSDIAWEREQVEISQETSTYVERAFGLNLPAGLHTMIECVTKLGLKPYDYTKRIDRSFQEARRLGYHLTLSWGGKHDDTIFAVAKQLGLNVAAPVYGIKRKKALPETIEHGGNSYSVIDGDVTDARWTDPDGDTFIIGLRLKRTPGQTEALARRFCIV